MSQIRVPVSIVAPVKNAEKHLPNLRTQILNTSSPHDEVLIIDDHSEDQTAHILDIWAKEDSRVRVIKNRSYGLAEALNTGISEARFDWIGRVDADDQYHQDRFDRQFLSIDSATVAVFSDYTFRTSSDKYLGFMPSGLHELAVAVSLINSRRTAHPVALIRKDAVLAAGGYRSQDFPAEDLSLWLRLSRVGKLVSSPENLLRYTLSVNGVSLSSRKLQLRSRDAIISSIGLESSFQAKAMGSIEDVIHSYTESTYPALRSLLFMKDLSSLTGTSTLALVRESGINFEKTTHEIPALSEIAQFYLFGALRKSYRSYNSLPF